jgi:hypothetical protein
MGMQRGKIAIGHLLVPDCAVGHTITQGLDHGIPECNAWLDVALTENNKQQRPLSLRIPSERHAAV